MSIKGTVKVGRVTRSLGVSTERPVRLYDRGRYNQIGAKVDLPAGQMTTPDQNSRPCGVYRGGGAKIIQSKIERGLGGRTIEARSCA